MILAFDAGTSSVKAVVASQSSQGGWVVHAQAVSAHDAPDTRASGEAEQNPHSWWEALVRAVRTLAEQTDLDTVEAISLSGQMQSVILVGATGAAVRPALLYSDTRATAEAAELEAKLGLRRLQDETLNWKGAASVLPKLLWLSRHEPASLTAASAIHLAAHDFLFARLAAPAAEARGGAAGGGSGGGAHVTDATNASTAGLLLASGGDPTPTPTPTPNPNPNPQTHPHPNSNSHPNASRGGWAASLVRDAGLPERLVRGACMRSARYAVHAMRCTLCGARPCHARHIP